MQTQSSNPILPITIPTIHRGLRTIQKAKAALPEELPFPRITGITPNQRSILDKARKLHKRAARLQPDTPHWCKCERWMDALDAWREALWALNIRGYTVPTAGIKGERLFDRCDRQAMQVEEIPSQQDHFERLCALTAKIGAHTNEIIARDLRAQVIRGLIFP